MYSKTDINKWVEDYGDYLYRYAITKVNDDSVAEDLVQDTFLAGISGLNNFNGKSSIKTWLSSILNNKIFDYYNTNKKMVSYDANEGGIEDFFDNSGHWVEQPKYFENPDVALENKQLNTVYQNCLKKLKKEQADIFIAKEIQELDNIEVMKRFNVSASNIWTTLHRTRLLLTKCMEINLK